MNPDSPPPLGRGSSVVMFGLGLSAAHPLHSVIIVIINSIIIIIIINSIIIIINIYIYIYTYVCMCICIYIYIYIYISATLQTDSSHTNILRVEISGASPAFLGDSTFVCFFGSEESFLVRMECPAWCSEGWRPLIAGCLSLWTCGMDLPVTRPVWDSNP